MCTMTQDDHAVCTTHHAIASQLQDVALAVLLCFITLLHDKHRVANNLKQDPSRQKSIISMQHQDNMVHI